MHTPDVTPETHPDHHTVGKRFRSWDAKTYLCVSHDPCGYNMQNESDPMDLRNISERAIGRTFHRIYRDEHGEHTAMGAVR